MVETAAAALLVLEPASTQPPAHTPNPGIQTLSCGPLIALAMARARGDRIVEVRGAWRGREAATTVGVGSESPASPGRKER